MLLSLRIENFALIERLELEVAAGLNVLTGETGAGKSIILDAIDIVLGAKATSRVIRTGAERSLLEASFALEPRLQTWLIVQEIEPLEGDLVVCTREIANTQNTFRSRSRVNGVLVNRQQMESLREHLVDITAQGQTVQLGQASAQREWLDSFAGQAVLQQRSQVTAAFTAFQQAQKALEQYRLSERQRLQQQDLLEYQVRELHGANLMDPHELEQLEQERQRLSHSVELQQQSYQVYQAVYQNDTGERAAADLLGQAAATLSAMSRYDIQVQAISDLVNDALVQVEEAGRQISAYGESLETDPQRLQVVEERLVELKQICRKYGPTLAEAIAYVQRIEVELEEMTGGGQSLEALEQNFQEYQTALTEACGHLRQLRQAAAQELEARLVAELQPLAMEKVKFQVEISPTSPTNHGADIIRFLFSPNPGEPLQPLSETASGGEMSRFLLALKACFSQVDPVGSLVFDEIDVGVSGRVAQAIAEKLHQLSRHHQVFCVTHQPIVAALADHHFRVEKTIAHVGPASEARTVVQVTALDDQQRREELAQLAGGRSAEDAMAFVDSLLQQAGQLHQGQPTPAQPQPAKLASRRTKLKSAKKSSTH